MKLALLVGINDYNNPENNLFCPVNDCFELNKVLTSDNYGFHCFSLNDEEATKGNIKSYFSIFEEETDIEEFFFYFSGHGLSTKTETYICTYDFEKYDEGITIGQLARMVSALIDKNIKVTVVLDCCYAGSFSLYRSQGYLPILSDRVDSDFSIFNCNFSLLAACGNSEISSQNEDKGLSEFTIRLIEALNGSCADEKGFITITSLFKYINEEYSGKGWPRALLKATICDDYFLGRNFPPRILKLKNKGEMIQDIIEYGKNLLNDYIKIGEGGVDEWRLFQFSESCKKLESIMQWISSNEARNLELKINHDFLLLKNAVTARLKRLGSIEEGMKFNDFIFIERIGSGSFGTVWKCKNNLTNETRAFKIYHSNEIDISEKVSRFRRGYKAMQRIKHPQIVKVINWYEAPFAFDMEFIEGHNLRELAGAISEEEDIINFFISLASVLEFSHRNGIMHRDIKPENIMAIYDAEKEIYIPVVTDFDLAWFDTATKMTKEALGSISYAAPEQVDIPDARITHAPTVDIYSFGQVLFFMIMGNDPRQNATEYNLDNLSRALSRWISPTVARSIEVLYKKCVEITPSNRFKTFNEIITFLQGIATEQKKLSNPFIPEENYIDFVLHGFSSVSTRMREDGFISVTGRTVISISIENRNVIIDLSVNGLPLFNEASNKAARKILFERLSNKFKQYRNIEIKHGKEGAFQVYLVVHLKALDLESLDQVRSCISTSILEMER